MNPSLCSSLFFSLVAQPALSATLAFDDAPFSAGSRSITSFSEQGYTTSGRFGHAGTQNPNRASNTSTGFLEVISGGHVTVRVTSGTLFNARSVELSEYSVVFPYSAEIQFFGLRVDGVTVSTLFRTDGSFDGPGGVEDFERFVFPDSFNNLQSLYTRTINRDVGDDPFSMDNLTVDVVPEPTAVVSLVCGALALTVGRKRAR